MGGSCNTKTEGATPALILAAPYFSSFSKIVESKPRPNAYLPVDAIAALRRSGWLAFLFTFGNHT
jgi:hypothetical protein